MNQLSCCLFVLLGISPQRRVFAAFAPSWYNSRSSPGFLTELRAAASSTLRPTFVKHQTVLIAAIDDNGGGADFHDGGICWMAVPLMRQ